MVNITFASVSNISDPTTIKQNFCILALQETHANETVGNPLEVALGSSPRM